MPVDDAIKIGENEEEESQQVTLAPLFQDAVLAANPTEPPQPLEIDLGDMTQVSSAADEAAAPAGLPSTAQPVTDDGEMGTQVSNDALGDATQVNYGLAEHGQAFDDLSEFPEDHSQDIPISEYVQMSDSPSAAANIVKRWSLIISGFSGAAIIVLLVLVGVEAQRNPLVVIAEGFGLVEPEQTMVVVKSRAPVGPKAEPSVEPVEVVGPPANPYWDLPNQVIRKKPGSNRISFEERRVLESGINHEFFYQRFKTVEEIRGLGLAGASFILRQALAEKKFWIRMYAVMGLAEFGEPVDVDMVDLAIGDARPDLVANFFKRFRAQRSEGELYVMREALKVVDASARRVILEVLDQTDDNLRGLYLVAGTYDPGAGIREYARYALTRKNINPAVRKQFQNIVLGQTGDGNLTETVDSPEDPVASVPVLQAVTDGASDLEQEISEIEFHEEDQAQGIAVDSEKISGIESVEDGFEDLEYIEIGGDAPSKN